MMIESSYEVQFLQDNTVSARNSAPTVSRSFRARLCDQYQQRSGDYHYGFCGRQRERCTESGSGHRHRDPCADVRPGTYAYTLTAASASDKVEATPAQAGAQVEISYGGKNIRNGGTVTWTADGTAHPLTVTVKQGNAVRVYTINVTKAGG